MSSTRNNLTRWTDFTIADFEGNLKTAAKGLTSGQDVKAIAQMMVSILEKDVESMMEKGTFDVDIDALIQNIEPNAVAKLFSKHSRRGLLGDILNGLKGTLGDTLGLLFGTAFANLKRFLDSVTSNAEQSLTLALKSLAHTFLANTGNATAQVAAEAVKFFQPFQTQLGTLNDYTRDLE
ncbi:uncharacterized protein [Haliotis cracherodii]|uniref:uncharacterized protein n=1 Tax=Haliotis cracherodii TaxID=6455 RepID=UPI0039E7D4F0